MGTAFAVVLVMLVVVVVEEEDSVDECRHAELCDGEYMAAQQSACLWQLAHDTDAALALLLHLGGDALCTVLLVCRWCSSGHRLGVQPGINEKAMHVRPQQRAAQQRV